MKQGDIFSRMTAELRIRKVAARQYHFQEVYQTPDELIADLSILIANMDKAGATRDQLALDLRRVLQTKVEVLNDFAQAFRKFDFAFNVKMPDLPILYEGNKQP